MKRLFHSVLVDRRERRANEPLCPVMTPMHHLWPEERASAYYRLWQAEEGERAGEKDRRRGNRSREEREVIKEHVLRLWAESARESMKNRESQEVR